MGIFEYVILIFLIIGCVGGAFFFVFVFTTDFNVVWQGHWEKINCTPEIKSETMFVSGNVSVCSLDYPICFNVSAEDVTISKPTKKEKCTYIWVK